MPRKIPLSNREIEVCHRLRDIRKALGCERAFLGRSIGADPSAIKRVELLRAPLRYALAYKIITFLQFNAYWLATGRGQDEPYVALPSPAAVGVRKTALFTEVFDCLLERHLRAALPVEKISKGDMFKVFESETIRNNKMFWIKQHFQDWLNQLPDSVLNEFVEDVFKHSKLLFERCEHDTWQNILERRQHNLVLRNFRDVMDRWGDSKDNLDSPPPLDILSGVRIKVPTWKELKRNIASLTSQRGEKAALAEKLGVSRQVLNNWLSDEGQGAPNAELTLRLFDWVLQQKERNQK